MITPDRDRATDWLSNPDSRSAERSGARSAPAPMAVRPHASAASGADKTCWRRGRRSRRPERLPSRVRFRPQVGLLEQRALLSATGESQVNINPYVNSNLQKYTDEKTWLRGWSRAERSRRRGRGLLVEALEPRQLLSLTLTAAGLAAGFGLSTFASGFPTVKVSFGTAGPLGIAFPTTGGVLVSDYPGNVRLFLSDTDGQNAANAPLGQSYGQAHAAGLAQFGSNVYMTGGQLGNVVQINNNGTFNQTIVGLPGGNTNGIIADPFNGHVFVSSEGNGTIYDVNPTTKTATPFVARFRTDFRCPPMAAPFMPRSRVAA